MKVELLVGLNIAVYTEMEYSKLSKIRVEVHLQYLKNHEAGKEYTHLTKTCQGRPFQCRKYKSILLIFDLSSIGKNNDFNRQESTIIIDFNLMNYSQTDRCRKVQV